MIHLETVIIQILASEHIIFVCSVEHVEKCYSMWFVRGHKMGANWNSGWLMLVLVARRPHRDRLLAWKSNGHRRGAKEVAFGNWSRHWFCSWLYIWDSPVNGFPLKNTLIIWKSSSWLNEIYWKHQPDLSWGISLVIYPSNGNLRYLPNIYIYIVLSCLSWWMYIVPCKR